MLILKQLARDYNITQAELATILNVRQPDVSRMMSGLREIRPEHIALLEQRFGKDVVASYDLSNEQYEEWRNRASKAIQATIIPADVVDSVKADIEEAESIPILSEDLSTATDLDIRAYLDENGDELERINPSQMLQRADLAEKVIKTSMLPTFAPGDIVFVRFMRDKAKLVDGDTYYFDLKSRPTMIRKVKIEGDKLRLVALNPDYGDIITDRNDIISVAKIIGLLRMTFADFYSDIEEARRRKEEQIENLIDKHNTHVESLVSQIDKMGERENRLISMIENKLNQ
ncbi:MAG: helix-turn-helix domain-containing protein [Alistipes sp.]|nr:helix-turn-helix domain-containing protein [Alistipes sp.]